MDPAAKMGQNRWQVVLEAIAEKEGAAVRGEAPGHLMQHPLGHRQGPWPYINRQEQFRLRIHGRPDPMRRRRQTSNDLVLTEVTSLHSTEDGVELVHLELAHVDLTQEIMCKGLKLDHSFAQPLQAPCWGQPRTRALWPEYPGLQPNTPVRVRSAPRGPASHERVCHDARENSLYRQCSGIGARDRH